MEKTKPNKESILAIKKSEQYRTADELISRSQPSSTYYTLLFVSSLVISSGLLLQNSFIVTGGMLITPVLAPILVVAMGISIGEVKVIKEASVLLGKSFLVILLSAFVLALLIGSAKTPDIFTSSNRITTAFLYFIVAISAGVAATFAWTRKEMSDALIGIAIAVSLVPPLGLIGISLPAKNWIAAQFHLIVFVLNLFGVLAGSLIVFSLLKFHKAQHHIQEQISENNTSKKQIT